MPALRNKPIKSQPTLSELAAIYTAILSALSPDYRDYIATLFRRDYQAIAPLLEQFWLTLHHHTLPNRNGEDQ